MLSESLLASCYHGLHDLVQSGQGSLALRAFGCLIMVAFVGFVCVAGKWMLMFVSKIRKADWQAAGLSDSKLMNILTSCLPYTKVFVASFVLLVIIILLWSFFGPKNFSLPHHPLWAYVIFTIAIFCVIRSLWLLYNHWYERDESLDIEEAQWFWGWSSILIVVVSIMEIMYIIPARVLTPEGVVSSESLLISCYYALQDLIRSGQGSGGLRALALLIFIVPLAFAYVAGKWLLIFVSRRIWEE